jgi:hypothetical protein
MPPSRGASVAGTGVGPLDQHRPVGARHEASGDGCDFSVARLPGEAAMVPWCRVFGA